jgi:hypothetical protein
MKGIEGKNKFFHYIPKKSSLVSDAKFKAFTLKVTLN